MPFSQKTLDFLFENRLHDSRDWFAAHKSDYQKFVFDPLAELVEALAPHMLEIDGQLTTEPRVDRTICRIRRDTRYSHDKSLYRDTMWIIFKRGKMHGTTVPGLYFEIAQDGFNYGCGFYDAGTQYMALLRERILQNDKLFLKAQKVFLHQDLYQMEGDCFKRPHFPDASPQLGQWLERRNISFIAESGDFDLLFSPALPAKLAEDYRLLAPIYEFLLQTALAVNRAELTR